MSRKNVEKEITMNDPIGQVGKTVIPLPLKTEGFTPGVNQTPSASENTGLNKDQFILSAASENALSEAKFDGAKVAELKAAISEGRYPVDVQKVAEKFIALEGMIGGE